MRKPVRGTEMVQLYQQLVEEHVGEIANGLFNEVNEDGQIIQLIFCEAAFDDFLEILIFEELGNSEALTEWFVNYLD